MVMFWENLETLGLIFQNFHKLPHIEVFLLCFYFRLDDAETDPLAHQVCANERTPHTLTYTHYIGRENFAKL